MQRGLHEAAVPMSRISKAQRARREKRLAILESIRLLHEGMTHTFHLMETGDLDRAARGLANLGTLLIDRHGEGERTR